jgi:hypothetical protein
MSDDKPSAFEDVRKGLGLLFRAARTAVKKLETRGVEEVVVTSAREVGRAIENVASTVEREVFGRRASRSSHENREDEDKEGKRPQESDEPPKPPEEPNPKP